MPFFTQANPPTVEQLKSWQLDKGTLINTPVPGFRASVAVAGLRKDGRIDVGLIASDKPVPVAAVFTQNKVPAAPVQVARQHLGGKLASAILANCGGANASTGQPGLDACISTCQTTAKALNVPPGQIFPCSTGVIGQLNELAPRINACVPNLAAKLKAEGLSSVARAIMTTDAFAKMAEAKLMLNNKSVTIVGMAKGAGMIRPDMATMLAFVLTDAEIDQPDLQKITHQASSISFNRASVDGDTSTNDTLLVLASGRAGNGPLDENALADLQAAISEVCQKLAAMLIMDGEGAQHLILVRVKGAASAPQADESCYAVAHSPLCKTAFNGCDPNWGRLLQTLGAVAARNDFPLQPDRTNVNIGGVDLAVNGLYAGREAEQKVAAIMQEKIYDITLNLNLGEHSFWIFTNDLGHEYIRINADYRS